MNASNTGALLVCGFLAAFSIPARADDAPRCRLLRAASLDLSYDAAQVPTVAVTIGGKPETLAVDTGGLYSMLTRSTAKDLGLKLQTLAPNRFKMFSGAPISYAVNANDFFVGGALRLNNYNFMILPDSEVTNETNGTLAPDILSRFDDDFDFGANKLNIYSQDHCPDKVVYWADDYARLPITFESTDGSLDVKHILTRAKLDGEDMRVSIDTGSTVSSMTLDRAQRLFHWDGDPAELKPAGDSKAGNPVYFYPFKTLVFDGVAISNPKILLHRLPPQHFENPQYDMILGMDVLSKLHVYIAYGEKALYVTPADARHVQAGGPATMQ